MNKPTPMKGKGHPNKVQTSSITKTDGKKKDDDSSFIYNLGILIGCVAEIETKKGEKFEGVLSAFTNQALKIMIEAAHEPTGDDESSITKHYDLLIVPADKVSVIKFRNAELSYATRDFQTDSAISATRQLSVGDKQLTPWEGDGATDFEELEGSSRATTNGWGAEDMFKENEARYGVKSSFKEDLSGYTTQIDKTDAENFKKHEEKAAQIAREIEGNQSSYERTKVENGDGDEEDAFSAVQRPTSRDPNPPVLNHAPQPPPSAAPPPSGSQKYIPPSRRHQNNVQPPPTGMQGHPANPPNNNNINNNNNNNFGSARHSGPDRKSHPNNQDKSYDTGANPNYRGMERNSFGRARGHPRDYPPGGSRVPEPAPRGGKPPRGRGRDSRENITDNLRNFKDNLRLTTPRPPHQHSGPGPQGSVLMTSPVGGPNGPPNVGNSQNVRNPSPPGGKAAQISTPSPVKPKKEEFSPVPPLIQPSGPASTISENSNGSGSTSPQSTSKAQTGAASASPSPNSSTSSVNPPSSSNNEAVPTTPVATEGQVPTVVSNNDSKSSTETDSKHKKTFTFNPNAKEFNPTAKSFTPQRSPSTPPRPPSTPASTQQLMPVPPTHSLMQMQMQPHQTLLYNPYTTHAQGLTPSSNSSASSGGNTPRHRKGMISAPSRPDMTPPMQITPGPPLLQAAGPPHAQFYVQHAVGGSYTPVVVPQVGGIVPLYQHEGGGAQMHASMSYIHNGATPPSNVGHQQAPTPQGNPNAPTSNVPTNGHAFGPGGANHAAPPHMGYHHPYVVQMPRQQHMMIPTYVNHVIHQGGGNSGLPHSQ